MPANRVLYLYIQVIFTRVVVVSYNCRERLHCLSLVFYNLDDDREGRRRRQQMDDFVPVKWVAVVGGSDDDNEPDISRTQALPSDSIYNGMLENKGNIICSIIIVPIFI